MSWKGLTKAVNRAGTTLMQKTGQVDRTVDSEFSQEEQKYRTLEKSSSLLQKEAKTYLDSIRAMTAAQARLAETIDSFYADNSDAAMAANSYRRAVGELESKTARELDAPFRATVLEPIGKMCSSWPEINKAIEKRNKKLLDYDAARTKARKLIEKPSDDASKLPIAERQAEEAREVFEVLNQQLLNDLPILLDLRVNFLDPSFESMVRLQQIFAQEGYEKMGGVQRYFSENVRDDYASGALDSQVENALADLSTLSICGMAG